MEDPPTALAFDNSTSPKSVWGGVYVADSQLPASFEVGTMQQLCSDRRKTDAGTMRQLFSTPVTDRRQATKAALVQQRPSNWQHRRASPIAGVIVHPPQDLTAMGTQISAAACAAAQCRAMSSSMERTVECSPDGSMMASASKPPASNRKPNRRLALDIPKVSERGTVFPTKCVPSSKHTKTTGPGRPSLLQQTEALAEKIEVAEKIVRSTKVIGPYHESSVRSPSGLSLSVRPPSISEFGCSSTLAPTHLVHSDGDWRVPQMDGSPTDAAADGAAPVVRRRPRRSSVFCMSPLEPETDANLTTSDAELADVDAAPAVQRRKRRGRRGSIFSVGDDDSAIESVAKGIEAGANGATGTVTVESELLDKHADILSKRSCRGGYSLAPISRLKSISPHASVPTCTLPCTKPSFESSAPVIQLDAMVTELPADPDTWHGPRAVTSVDAYQVEENGVEADGTYGIEESIGKAEDGVEDDEDGVDVNGVEEDVEVGSPGRVKDGSQTEWSRSPKDGLKLKPSGHEAHGEPDQLAPSQEPAGIFWSSKTGKLMTHPSPNTVTKAGPTKSNGVPPLSQGTLTQSPNLRQQIVPTSLQQSPLQNNSSSLTHIEERHAECPKPSYLELLQRAKMGHNVKSRTTRNAAAGTPTQKQQSLRSSVDLPALKETQLEDLDGVAAAAREVKRSAIVQQRPSQMQKRAERLADGLQALALEKKDGSVCQVPEAAEADGSLSARSEPDQLSPTLSRTEQELPISLDDSFASNKAMSQSTRLQYPLVPLDKAKQRIQKKAQHHAKKAKRRASTQHVRENDGREHLLVAKGGHRRNSIPTYKSTPKVVATPSGEMFRGDLWVQQPLHSTGLTSPNA